MPSCPMVSVLKYAIGNNIKIKILANNKYFKIIFPEFLNLKIKIIDIGMKMINPSYLTIVNNAVSNPPSHYTF